MKKDLTLNKNIIYTNFNPYWIAGFIDAEGCFRVNVYPNNEKILGVSISFTFHISQKETKILETIKEFFNMGQIVWDSREKKIKKYHLTSLDNCLNLIKFLDLYSLQTSKALDFEDFKKSLLFWSNKNNHTLEGVATLKDLIKNMNNNRNLTERYNYLNSKFNDKLNPHWIVGFIDGEGCFYCYIQKDTKSPIIQLSLEISQSTHDWLILEKLRQELNCGRLKITTEMKNNLNDVSRLIIMNNSDLTDKIIPFFEKYSLLSKKRLDYEDFKLLWQNKKEKKHLTDTGLNQMKLIKTNMNFGREPGKKVFG